MALSRAWSVALFGIDGVAVEIEADLGGGRPRTQILGLPDASLSEAKPRRIRRQTRRWGHANWTQRLHTVPIAWPPGRPSPTHLPEVL